MRLSEAIDLLDHPSLHSALATLAPTPLNFERLRPSPFLVRSFRYAQEPSPTPPQPTSPLRWADLGCGQGLFTEALARLLPAGSTVYGIDLRPQLHTDTVNGVTLIPLSGDFINTPILLRDLDGILMANSFHYVRDKAPFLQKLRDSLRPGAPLLIVEYDTDRPVPTWVPWPASFATLQPLLKEAGWPHITKLGSFPSAFGGTMYAALAQSP